MEINYKLNQEVCVEIEHPLLPDYSQFVNCRIIDLHEVGFKDESTYLAVNLEPLEPLEDWVEHEDFIDVNINRLIEPIVYNK